MKNKLFRIAALLLAVVLSLGVTSCAKQQSQPEPGLTYAELMATVMHTNDSTLSQVINNVQQWGVAGDGLWAYGYLTDYDTSDTQGPFFATMDIDGSNVASVALTMPEKAFEAGEGEKAGAVIEALTVAADGTVWALISDELQQDQAVTSSVTGGEFYKELKSQKALCTVGADGALIRKAVLELPAPQEGEPYFGYGTHFNSFYAVADGSFWVVLNKNFTDEEGLPVTAGSSSAVYRFGADGKLLYQFDLQYNNMLQYSCRAFRPIPGGDFLVTTAHEQNGVAYNEHVRDVFKVSIYGVDTWLLDENTGALASLTKEKQVYHWNANQNVLQTDPADTRILAWDHEIGVHQYNLDTEKKETMFEWMQYDIPGETVQLVIATGESTYTIVTKSGRRADYRFRTLRTDMGDLLDGKEALTLGIVGTISEEMQEAVSSYNLTDPAMYIKTVKYSDPQALEKDIISRTAPDILVLQNDLSNNNYIRQGLFLDLYPYLDADPELSRDDLQANVLAASEYDGQLPTLVLGYAIWTTVGDPDVVGAAPGWTWAEFDALTAAYPDAVPINQVDRELMLLYLLQLGGDKFIDYTTGTAHLDSPDFADLLTASAGYPAQNQSTDADLKVVFSTGQALLQIKALIDFRDVLSQEYTFDGPVVYKGYPSDSGAGSAIAPVLRVGISSTCKQPDAAWAFLRKLLMPGFQSSMKNCLPLNKQVLADMGETAMQPVDPQMIGFSFPSYLPFPLTDAQTAYFSQGATQAHVDQVMAAIESADTLYQYDGYIADILYEEASAFYSGARTAEEAAAIMQNRVQTYLDEQG